MIFYIQYHKVSRPFRDLMFMFKFADLILVFRLYILFNTNDYPQYPYVGVSEDTTRIIVLTEDHVGILEREDSVYFENDYLPTSRSIELDLAELDSLVNGYTGQFEYSILTRFGAEKHITLTYHSPTNEAPKHYDIFENYPEPRAQKLVAQLYPMMEKIRDGVYE